MIEPTNHKKTKRRKGKELNLSKCNIDRSFYKKHLSWLNKFAQIQHAAIFTNTIIGKYRYLAANKLRKDTKWGEPDKIN